MISDNPPGPDMVRRSRRWIWPLLAVLLLLIVVWVPNASRPGSRAEGCSPGCTTAALRAKGPLRVLSLNMLHGFSTFEHRVALQATAVTPRGDLRVLSTHLTHGDPSANEAQAGLLTTLSEASGS